MSFLEADSVTVRFVAHDAAGRRFTRVAVDDVSFEIGEGERLGLVGESGSGKTTLGKAVLALEETARGTVRFKGADVHCLRGEALRAFRRSAQMVFQDPMGALNPRMTVGTALEEVLAVHHIVPRAERRTSVAALLDRVGLAAAYADRYPHEFSGGQRQRVGIARALALSPALIVADEPVSALDVSVQAQVLNLLKDVSEADRMACLLIAHDLAVVNYVCRRVMVMYRGRVVESGPAADVLGRPAHPYTQALKAAAPDPDRVGEPDRDPGGSSEPASTSAGGSAGCCFAPRCPLATERCRREIPLLREAGTGRHVACHGVR